MPLPRATVLQSNQTIARNTDWDLSQTSAPAAGPGLMPEKLKARIAPESLPKSEPITVSGSVAGHTITQHGTRNKVGGSITFVCSEAVDGESSAYFEALKALNNPRGADGNLTGVGVLEEDKEGEYSFRIKGPDGKQVKRYVIKFAVVSDVESGSLSKSEDAEYLELKITVDYKDFVIYDANDNVIG